MKEAPGAGKKGKKLEKCKYMYIFLILQFEMLVA